MFLSANSFVNPFEHLNQGVNKRMVQSYIAYLKDDTRLISNPGLKVQYVFDHLFIETCVSFVA